jgi:hypothetical protein
MLVFNKYFYKKNQSYTLETVSLSYATSFTKQKAVLDERRGPPPSSDAGTSQQKRCRA